jgi:hypothetical protein
MRMKLLVMTVLAVCVPVGVAMAKGGPPSGNGNNGQAHGTSKKDAPDSAQANKAAVTAKKAQQFRRQTRALGYTCRPGTTHLRGTVVAVVPPTATAAGSLTVLVTQANRAGRALVGTEVTVTLLTSTDVVDVGHTTAGSLTVGSTVVLDTRSCTAADADPTDGVTPGAELVARKIVAKH